MKKKNPYNPYIFLIRTFQKKKPYNQLRKDKNFDKKTY